MESTTSRKKKSKKDAVPKFAVGDTVTTKSAVRVPLKGVNGRKHFFITPGGEWKVLAVELNGPRQPVYRLKCDKYEIERKELRLKRLK